jgi:hypothetical protein
MFELNCCVDAAEEEGEPVYGGVTAGGGVDGPLK